MKFNSPDFYIVILFSVISTVLSLLTKKFPFTFIFLFKIVYFYLYIFYFIIISAIAYILIENDVITFKIAAYDGIWFKAPLIGLLNYQLSQVTLESKIGDKTKGISISGMFHYFDGWLEFRMYDEHRMRLRHCIEQEFPLVVKADKHRVAGHIIQYIKDMDAGTKNKNSFKRTSIVESIREADSVIFMLLTYLTHYGYKRFKLTFLNFQL